MFLLMKISQVMVSDSAPHLLPRRTARKPGGAIEAHMEVCIAL